MTCIQVGQALPASAIRNLRIRVPEGLAVIDPCTCAPGRDPLSPKIICTPIWSFAGNSSSLGVGRFVGDMRMIIAIYIHMQYKMLQCLKVWMPTPKLHDKKKKKKGPELFFFFKIKKKKHESSFEYRHLESTLSYESQQSRLGQPIHLSKTKGHNDTRQSLPSRFHHPHKLVVVVAKR